MHRLLIPFKNNHSLANHDSGKPINGSSNDGIIASSVAFSEVSERSDDEEGSEFRLDRTPLEDPGPDVGVHIEGTELANLVAQYGHAPATAWLERTRYRIWRPSDSVSGSSFLPIQGYLHANSWVFAWGSPLVSDKAALNPTIAQFVAWAQSHSFRLVYCCVPEEIEEILANMGWSTVSCVSEDVVDPQHILAITREEDEGGHGSMVKDLKKNLRRAERANVKVRRITRQDWSDELKREIEDGIVTWKNARKGLQLAATSFDPWLDFENRKYWIALQHGKVIGVLILSPAGDSYVIKNAAQFPDAPKGTSERLIHTVLRDLQQSSERTADRDPGHTRVTFNLSAASDLKPTRNISGWKFVWLNQTYSKIARGARLLNRHDFRRKFDAAARRMFVCYPTEDGFGLDGIEKLLEALRR